VIFSYPQGMILFNITLWVYELCWYMNFAFKLRTLCVDCYHQSSEHKDKISVVRLQVFTP